MDGMTKSGVDAVNPVLLSSSHTEMHDQRKGGGNFRKKDGRLDSEQSVISPKAFLDMCKSE